MTKPLIFSLLLLSAAYAQETRGVIFGHVLDSQKAAVAGATVVALNTATNAAANLTTNETGYYEANFLIAGALQIPRRSQHGCLAEGQCPNGPLS